MAASLEPPSRPIAGRLMGSRACSVLRDAVRVGCGSGRPGQEVRGADDGVPYSLAMHPRLAGLIGWSPLHIRESAPNPTTSHPITGN